MSHRAELQQIRSFPQLIRFLRDEMGWPIESDDFDDLIFDYTAEELGLDAASAAKIKEIKRLRPLAANQPWGIFFVSFEPKRLPVVALRRILSAFVMRKRASANEAERMAWETDDLLFISNHGEGDERQLSFAHFSRVEHGGLPTLRVLGWDNLDTPLHLDYVANRLTEKLAWPRSESDVDLWRETWGSAFTLRHGEVIATSKALAVRLAVLARAIRDRIKTVLAIETESGPVTQLMKAFKEALVHDLEPDDFADMYAQTVAYGLLSARIADPKAKTADGFARQLPITSPFLKELMKTFLHVGGRGRGGAVASDIDFDELGVSEVVELLDSPKTNMEAVIRDFGDRNPQEDPVIHFYEDFLKEYDKTQKVKRGVFYTPRPVVSFIVRSVDELLRIEFGLADGLADTTTWDEMAKRHKGIAIPKDVPPDQAFVQILDPATGTGTFLVEVIGLVHTTLLTKWKAQDCTEVEIESLWNDYVPRHLLTRLHGYELLMAPYAIAHLKVGLKLHETGYRFDGESRAQIYLTNALEPPRDLADRFEFAIPALAHEARAVNDIKSHHQFTVIIGNPPYSGHSRNNEIGWIVEKVRDFTRKEPSLQGPGQGKWLQDDYVKFLRLGQHLLGTARPACLAMITNHRYLTNRTFKGMRRQWLEAFSYIRVIDLHGNRVVNEVSPLGYDENVFDIEQGVAIGLFARGCSEIPSVAHSGLWGARTSPDGTGKYEILLKSSPDDIDWQAIWPQPSEWSFSPDGVSDEDVRMEFESWLSLQELMPGALGPNGKPQSGLATMHDSFALSFTPQETRTKVRQFMQTGSREEAKALFGTLCNPKQWDYDTAKQRLDSSDWQQKVTKLWYAPLDVRYTVYDRAVAVHLRRRLSDHLFNRDNIALVVGEAGQEIGGDQWDAVCCVDGLLQLNFFRRNGSPTFPLYLYEDGLLAESGGPSRRVNYSQRELRKVAEQLGVPVGENGLPKGVGARQLLAYIYAVLHAPSYRSRYTELLKSSFPRLPVPTSIKLFQQLSDAGERLLALHLLESSIFFSVPVTYFGPRNPEVGRVGWSDDTVWLDAPAAKKVQPGAIGFHGVPQAVWNFHIGGYRVCEKWLKDRKGRILSDDDIAHYQKIVVAIAETIRIMGEIDEVIEEHGGWPGAFGPSREP